MFDRVNIDFTHDTHISDQVIPAGHYQMKQLRESAAASHIMLVLKNGGRDYQASAITIPALANNTPNATRAVIRRVGANYYLDTIWIAGKDYGYQFQLPAETKSRLNEQAETASLNLNYQAPQQVVAAAPPPPAPAPPPRQEREIAQAPPPAPPPPQQPEAAPAPPPPAPQPPQRLPQTASGWANILALGVAATGLALILKLRRKA